jgi:hypothetical protein
MNKFIVILPNITPAQQLAFKGLFPPDRVAWWHYSSDVWLLTFPAENPSALQLQEQIRSLFPTANLLVFRVPQGAEWSGWAPKGWKNWFDQFWL